MFKSKVFRNFRTRQHVIIDKFMDY